jgi:uncharacterized surface protein with fasciclin (FAS1) repeats
MTTMTLMMMLFNIINNNASPSIESKFSSRNNSKESRSIDNRILESKSGKSAKSHSHSHTHSHSHSNSNKSEKSSETHTHSKSEKSSHTHTHSKSEKSSHTHTHSKSEKSSHTHTHSKSYKSNGEGKGKSSKSEKSKGKGKGGENTRSPIFSPIQNPTRTPTKKPTDIPTMFEPADIPIEAASLSPTATTPSPTASALPTTSPTDTRGKCEDSNTFRFNNEVDKNCDTWVSKNPAKRCLRIDPATEKNVRYFCPNICKTKCKTKSPKASPTSAPTTNDRGECEDSNTFRFNNEVDKNCDTWVSKNPAKRCKKNDPVTGKDVKFFCPKICKTKCKTKSPKASPTSAPTTNDRGECEDSVTFRFNNEQNKECNGWVSAQPKQRCKKNDPVTGKDVKFFCPKICKTKCKSTPSVDSNSIMDIATRITYLSTLVDLIFQAGLYGTLSGAGPFTVFAPTNAAFLESLVGDKTSLSAEQLFSILTYHVVEGIYPVTDLKDGTILTTIQGDTLSFERTEETVEFTNGQRIIVPNILATNGIVHFIDGVLIPKR